MSSNTEAEPVMLKGKLFYTIELTLQERLMVPNGPAGTRMIVAVTGKVYGPALNGEVVAPTSEWATIGSNGVLAGIDLRAVIRTDDGQLIYQHVIGRTAQDLPDNPSNFIIRSGVTFEASPGKYQYLNNKFVFGHGTMTGDKIKVEYYDTS